MACSIKNQAPESDETLSELERRILNDYQRDFPLDSSPYATIARQVGCDEEMVLRTINKLRVSGYISRVGAVFRANTIGVSTLAAMTVPAMTWNGEAGSTRG